MAQSMLLQSSCLQYCNRIFIFIITWSQRGLMMHINGGNADIMRQNDDVFANTTAHGRTVIMRIYIPFTCNSWEIRRFSQIKSKLSRKTNHYMHSNVDKNYLFCIIEFASFQDQYSCDRRTLLATPQV